jgi:hypothetical protein
MACSTASPPTRGCLSSRRVIHLKLASRRCESLDGWLCACGDKSRREVRPSPHAAPARDELRTASNRSEHEPTSVRSTRCGSGHPIRAFRGTGCTFSWLQASPCAKSAPGRLDRAPGVGEAGGTLRKEQCLTRLPQHCECLPDGEHNAMIRPHATTFPSGCRVAAFTHWSGAEARYVQRICRESGFIARGNVSIVFRAARLSGSDS